MGEATMNETGHPRRTVRSVGAVLTGIGAGILLTICTHIVLHATGVFPPWGQPMIDADAVCLRRPIASSTVSRAATLRRGSRLIGRCSTLWCLAYLALS